jgi:predicted dehydrogenase
VTVRLGFLGAGLIAHAHAASLRTGAAAATIVAVHDPDRARAERFAATFGGDGGLRILDDPDAVIDAADAVYVCTWTAAHPDLVRRVAAAGKAVFCEKPLATTAAVAEDMVRTVEAAGVVNQVGLVLRSVPGFALVRALLRLPESGRLSTVVFRDDQDIPVGNGYGSTWRGDKDKAGAGTLLEHSIHDLDLLEWLCGPVASLSAYQDNLHGHDGIEDTVSVSFRFRSGGTGVLCSTWHDVPGRGSNRRFELFTERARIEAEGNAAESVSWEYRAGQGERSEGADQIARAGALGVVLPGNPDVAFVESVRTGRPAYPDFRVVLRAHLLVDAVYRSAAAGGAAITLPEPDGR